MKRIVLPSCFLLLGLSWVGCSTNLFFSPLAQPVRTFLVTPKSMPDPTFTPNVSIRQIQPALAVRGLGCLMCHANIRSNIVTDFGFPDPWYLSVPGIPGDAGHPPGNIEGYESWYANHKNSWQTAENITGQVFIPKANTPAILTYLGSDRISPMSLLNLFMTSYNRSEFPDGTNFPMSSKITPAGDRAKVEEKNTVLIGAPADSNILNLVEEFKNNPNQIGFREIRSLVSVAPPANFDLKGTPSKQYFSNPTTSSLNCYGDVVINGPLLLRRAKIATDQGGCRLYVRGTVFIEGSITYESETNGSNLQISSSKGIFMGIGTAVVDTYTEATCKTVSPLKCRLTIGSHNAMVREYNPYRPEAGRTWSDLANEILSDADKVSENGHLLDASEVASPGVWNEESKRASIDYHGLLLNAPVIQSRYLGHVKGTIVSEIALFALGKFHFEFDPVFLNPTTPTLPLLPDVLQVSDK